MYFRLSKIIVAASLTFSLALALPSCADDLEALFKEAMTGTSRSSVQIAQSKMRLLLLLLVDVSFLGLVLWVLVLVGGRVKIVGEEGPAEVGEVGGRSTVVLRRDSEKPIGSREPASLPLSPSRRMGW